MSTDTNTTDERHVTGTIGLSDSQLAGVPNTADNSATRSTRKPGPDGMALAAQTLFDIDGRNLRGSRLLQGVDTRALRSVVHTDIMGADDFPTTQGDDHVSLAYTEAMKLAGLLSAALNAAEDDVASGEIQQLITAGVSLLLQTRAVLARRNGENMGASSGDSTGK